MEPLFIDDRISMRGFPSWPKGPDFIDSGPNSRSGGAGLRGFESRPPHQPLFSYNKLFFLTYHIKYSPVEIWCSQSVSVKNSKCADWPKIASFCKDHSEKILFCINCLVVNKECFVSMFPLEMRGFKKYSQCCEM